MDRATQEIAALSARFEAVAGRAPTVVARAPGRVNLIGEHTDYTEGLVLPCAIDLHTTVVAAPRVDGRVVVHALDLDQSASFAPGQLERRGDWLDYLQGVVFALAERGHIVRGTELALASRVPTGSGLSSSAALGVAACAAITHLAGVDMAPRAWAEIAHRGESHFVGVGCGILDQFASALGRRDHALRIDCRSREATPVRFAAPAPSILLAHSGVTRRLAADGAYRARVDECAAAFDAAQHAGLAPASGRTLRDLPEAALEALEGLLPPTLYRRARHVVTENARVDRFCQHMSAGDWPKLGAILREGQTSLRDDFEVSTDELDHLCETADATDGVVGSRLTGAGFGGCTLHLVAPGRLEAVEAKIAEAFAARFGRSPQLIPVEIGPGASVQRL